MEQHEEKKGLKQKIHDEFIEYFFNFLYMAIIFSAIILYRRMILAEHDIFLEDYFLGVFKAFVIAKVVMLAAFLSISRKFENKALYIPVLYKSLLFTLCVILFDIIEIIVLELIHGAEILSAFSELENHINFIWLGSAMLIFFIFIPFFAFKELSRVMGEDKIRNLFLKDRKPALKDTDK